MLSSGLTLKGRTTGVWLSLGLLSGASGAVDAALGGGDHAIVVRIHEWRAGAEGYFLVDFIFPIAGKLGVGVSHSAGEAGVACWMVAAG